MQPPESEKFVIDRHPTIGDAAERRVPEPSASVHHATEQVLPLMRDVVICRNTCLALIAAFVILTVLPGLWALLAQFQPNSALRQNWRQLNLPVAVKTVTSALLDNSAPSVWLRRTWGASYTAITGDRVANVLIGQDGFLFYLPDYDACIGPPVLSHNQPDIVSNIVAYSNALDARGIHLVVLPVPTKTAILPFKLCPAYPINAGPALNPDYRQWIATLQAQGVDIVDLTDDYWKMAIAGNSPYQAQDSHWTPEAMALAAKRLADHVAPHLGTYSRKSYATRTAAIVTQGDLVGLLGLSGDFKHWPPMTLNETQVLIDGKPANIGDDAQVLVIGDSYTEMGSVPEAWSLGSAGLPHQLMLQLGTDVQFIAGSGALFPPSREALANRPLALKQKKVLIWEFTARYLPTESVALPPDLASSR